MCSVNRIFAFNFISVFIFIMKSFQSLSVTSFASIKCSLIICSFQILFIFTFLHKSELLSKGDNDKYLKLTS